MITSLSPHIFLVFPGDQTVQTRQQRNAKLSVHEKRITKRKAYRNVRVSRERERDGDDEPGLSLIFVFGFSLKR